MLGQKRCWMHETTLTLSIFLGPYDHHPSSSHCCYERDDFITFYRLRITCWLTCLPACLCMTYPLRSTRNEGLEFFWKGQTATFWLSCRFISCGGRDLMKCNFMFNSIYEQFFIFNDLSLGVFKSNIYLFFKSFCLPLVLCLF